MDRIKTAILGCGRSGTGLHGGAIEQLDAFDIVAVCDVDSGRRAEAAARFGAAAYGDHHEMLSREKLDFVSIVTRSDQHCGMTCDCLAAGVNVLVTKPWAVNEAEARRMIEARNRSGKLLLPWLPARWGSMLGRVKDFVKQGAVGKVFLVRHARTSFATRSDWQIERRYGGGYLLNWGPHVVDSPLRLLPARVRHVFGVLKQVINPGDTEDMFLAVMCLDDGSVAQAEYAVAAEELPDWFIQGDGGTIVARGRQLVVHRRQPSRPDDPTNFEAMKAADGETIRETVGGELTGNPVEVYAEAARALRGEKAFPVAPADALELTRILDAIRTSSMEKRVVSL